MSLIYSLRGDLGSLQNQTSKGNFATNTNTKIIGGDKSQCFRFISEDLTKIVLGDLGNVKSLAFAVKFKTDTEQLFEGAANDKLILANAGSMSYADFDDCFVDNENTDVIKVGANQLIFITSTTDVACAVATLGLNNTTYGNLDLAYFKAWDHELLPAERATEQTEFDNLRCLIQSPRTSFSFPAPTSISEVGLVGAWNGQRTSDGKYADISGEAHHITLTGALDAKGVKGRAIAFNGVSDTSVVLNVAEDIKSFKIICRIDNDTKDIVDFDGGTHYLKVNAGTLSAEGFVSPTIYVDGEAGTAIVTGKQHVIEVRTATAFTVSALRLGYAGNSYFHGIIDELEIRTIERELPAVQAAYNEIASLPAFNLDLKYAPADGITKVPVGVTLESGDTKIDEDEDEKYIEAVSDSIINISGVELNYLEKNGFIENIGGDLSDFKNHYVNDGNRLFYDNNVVRAAIATGEKLRSISILTGKRTFSSYSHPILSLPNIVEWWKIDWGALITRDAGDLVPSWLGSINAINLAAVGAARPTWTADQINGQPALVFDGTNHYLNGAFGVTYTQSNTIIIVVTEPTGNGLNRYFMDGDNSSNRHLFLQSGASNNYQIYAGAYLTNLGTIVGGNPWRIWSILYKDGNSLLRMNGNELGTGTAGTNNITGLTIASRNPITGAPAFTADIKVTDIIVVDGELTTAQFIQAETYLNALRGGIY